MTYYNKIIEILDKIDIDDEFIKNTRLDLKYNILLYKLNKLLKNLIDREKKFDGIVKARIVEKTIIYLNLIKEIVKYDNKIKEGVEVSTPSGLVRRRPP